MQPLPIDDALPALRAALGGAPSAVLEAPPGAGKTTRVPLALLDEPWLGGSKILMLEPRRIAARAAAARMANTLGEAVGGTVGYRIRHEARVGPSTRIEVLTEALLTRRLQSDPELGGVGLAIFDEFHERSLDADLGLALALETQAALRPDLKILVMSATLDGARVARLLGGAPVVRSEGRAFPVETVYAPPMPDARAFADAIARLTRRALAETDGGVLVFCPGEGEIRAVERRLVEGGLAPNVDVTPLYGALPFEAQVRAVAPATPGRRKVVLATSIAETSLTIEDVRAVVDGGLSRGPRFDPATGMTALATTRVSLAQAEQRRGRAGRVAPGRCYRPWAEEETRALSAFAPPEIAVADLAPLALDLAAWGTSDPAAYALLDPPPRAAYAQALELLRELGAVDARARITPHGRATARLGLHPRLAHMILRGDAMGLGATACALAGVLSERDVLRVDRDAPLCDLRARLDVMGRDAPPPGATVDRGALARARDNAKAWARQARTAPGEIDSDAAGRLLALAYPDRVAQRRGPRGSFRMRAGGGARLPETDALAGESFLAVGALDGGRDDARIFLAAPIALAEIEAAFADQVDDVEEVRWDAREGAVVARRVRRLGALMLAERRLDAPPADAVAAAMAEGLRALGLARLPWTPALRQLQARAAFLRALDGETSAILPMDDAALTEAVEAWASPFLDGMTRAAHLDRFDLDAALKARLGWETVCRLDAQAPTHLEVPSGSILPLDYSDAERQGGPTLAVRLQEMFGATETPTVAGGRAPVTLHLLSPAHRPVQVTKDLAGFWARTYADVKKDLKGRYPKHHWPDDPLAAPPTARAKRRGT